MDILNDNTNVEDSNSNNDRDSSLNDNSNNNNRDGINHERLTALSNYADENQDYASWYWNVGTITQRPPVGWQVYRPLSNLSEVERNEIRNGETRMVSYKDPDLYEGTGISLDWGEYYVADDEMDSSDDEQGTLSSFEEEAEEINDEELHKEEKQAVSLQEPSAIINFDQLDSDVDTSNPTLMGMPDIILVNIFHYMARNPSEVCVLERVCKRICRLTTGDDFWSRHPFWLGKPHRFCDFGASPKQAAFAYKGLSNIRKYQKGGTNAIMYVLGEVDCAASAFRTLSADILSKMNHIGPIVYFRLRGDTIGYICELLQGYMIDRLGTAMFLAIHKLGYSPYRREVMVGNGTRCTVQMDDIQLAFQKDMFSPFLCGFSPRRPTRCNVSMGAHGHGSALDCSCSLPSASGIIWKWPGDNCHEVLPPEAGRRIIRRLSYQAGIVQMSNEAFLLVEAELLHALGVLLVSAYESSVDMSKTTQFLDEEKELAYNEPTSSMDMFKIPPPPFNTPLGIEYCSIPFYTIVPGQIRAAAEERNVTPSSVYGDVWVASLGFTKNEEEEIERSYYYQSPEHSCYREEESSKAKQKSNAKQKEEPADDGKDSDTSAWSECSSIEDSELDLNDYEMDSYLAEYRFGSQEIEAHYNHFPPHPNNEEDEPDNDDNDSDEDMAGDNDA